MRAIITLVATLMCATSLHANESNVIVIDGQAKPRKYTQIFVEKNTVVECKPSPSIEVINLAIEVAQRGFPISQRVDCVVAEGQALPVGFGFEGTLEKVGIQSYGVVWKRINIPGNLGRLEWESTDYGFDTTANMDEGKLLLSFNNEMSALIQGRFF